MEPIPGGSRGLEAQVGIAEAKRTPSDAIQPTSMFLDWEKKPEYPVESWGEHANTGWRTSNPGGVR